VIFRSWRRISLAAPLVIVLLLAVWEIAVRVTGLPVWFLPPPSLVFIALAQMWPQLLTQSLYTVAEALSGLLAAVLVALVLASLMALSPRVRRGVYPLLVFSQTVPIITIAPLIAIWFGFGIMPKMVVVTLVCFFPVAVSVIEGMQAADAEMLKLLRVMGASRWQMIRLVQIPAALPSFFAGLKIAGTYAVMGAVIGEWLGAEKGLGLFMTTASRAYRADVVFAAIVVISLISLTLFALIELLSRLSIPWYHNERRR